MDCFWGSNGSIGKGTAHATWSQRDYAATGEKRHWVSLSLCAVGYPALEGTGLSVSGESRGSPICHPPVAKSLQPGKSCRVRTPNGSWAQFLSWAPCPDHQFLKVQMVLYIFQKHEAPALKVGFDKCAKTYLLIMKTDTCLNLRNLQLAQHVTAWARMEK